jgi:uncharacterized protein with HEPN domain
VTEVRVLLADAVEAARYIREYTTDGRDAFLASSLVRHAVNHNFAVMGEALNGIPDDFRSAHPEIPWRRIIDFRNVLIHGYRKILPARVWDTIEDELPAVIRALEAALLELGPPG